MRQARAIVGPFRVDQSEHARRHGPIGAVMVEHDHLGTGAERRERLGARRAAIDADDQPRSPRRQAQQRRRVRAVAFDQPVGDVRDHRAAESAEEAGHQRGGTGAVHVIVAEHRDRLAPLHGKSQAISGGVHVGEQRRVGQQRAQGGGEEIRRGFHPDAARGEQSPDDLRQFQPLGDGEAGVRDPANAVAIGFGLRCGVLAG